MSKRRTKKQKINAKHNYFSSNGISYNFEEDHKSKLSEANVNRQFVRTKKNPFQKTNKMNSTDIAIKNDSFKAVRLGLIKSILISILIISFELVLYLSWK